VFSNAAESFLLRHRVVSLYFPTAINSAERHCYLFKAFVQKSDEIISLYWWAARMFANGIFSDFALLPISLNSDVFKQSVTK